MMMMIKRQKNDRDDDETWHIFVDETTSVQM